MPKKQKKWVLRAAELLLSISVVFCFWGIFDCVNWAVLYGAENFPFPFFSFRTNVYAASDTFITIGVFSSYALALVSSYHIRMILRES